MKKSISWVVAILLVFGLSAQRAGAQDIAPSQSLKKVKTENESTIYSFNYPSVNARGEETVLSSALIAWTPSFRHDDDSIESVHIFCHVTITDDKERPSASQSLRDRQLLTTMIGRNYKLLSKQGDYVSRAIIIAPDYEGYGVTKTSPHPYLSQRLTARQVTDAVTYGMQLYRKAVEEGSQLAMKSDWRTFAYGCSQGGAVALATQRYIEEQGLADELHFKGSICCEGPYDLVATLRYYLEDDGDTSGISTDHRKGICTMPVVYPFIMKGMVDTHPDMKDYTINDLLSQQLIDTGVIDWLESKNFNTNGIHEMWYHQLQEGLDANGRHYTPEQMAELFESPSENMVWGDLKNMMTPEVYNYMNNPANFETVPAEPTNAAQALHRALVDNSLTTGWTPQHRIQFVHSKGDTAVPYANYLSWRDAQPQGDIYRVDDTFSKADHLDASIMFYMNLCLSRNFTDIFEWLSEQPAESGIKGIEWNKGNGTWYTLDGRKLQGKPASKGMYINNGKKVVIR